MSPRGRKAALPDDSPKTSRGLLDGEETRIVVRCFDEQEPTHKDYDFTALPVAEELRRGLAAAFERRTTPGAGLTSLESFDKPYFAACQFARYLATLPWPPARMADLAPERLNSFFREPQPPSEQRDRAWQPQAAAGTSGRAQRRNGRQGPRGGTAHPTRGAKDQLQQG